MPEDQSVSSRWLCVQPDLELPEQRRNSCSLFSHDMKLSALLSEAPQLQQLKRLSPASTVSASRDGKL